MTGPESTAPPTGVDSTGVDSTGDERVDAALGALDRTAALPPQEQIPEYEAAHRSLQETLASIDEG